MKIYLPVPPSANMLFRTTDGKRFKTAKYRSWIHAGCEYIQAQNIICPMLTEVHVELYVPRLRSNSDIDNRIKPVLDLLVKTDIIQDDSLVKSIYAEWVERDADCYVTIYGET